MHMVYVGSYSLVYQLSERNAVLSNLVIKHLLLPYGAMGVPHRGRAACIGIVGPPHLCLMERFDASVALW